MKIFILTSPLDGTGPVWMSIFWPHYAAIADSVSTELLAVPEVPGSGLRSRLDRLKFWKHSPFGDGEALRRQVLAGLDPHGPNILIVWALGRRDIERADLLAPIWDRFSHKVLSVVDNIEPEHALDKVVGRYDLITSFCGDLGPAWAAATGTPAIFYPPHTDALGFHTASSYRPVDLFLVGRRDKALHKPVHMHFNAPRSGRLSVDHVSRTLNFSYSAEEDFHLLMAGYGRAKLAFCFEASGNVRFRNRSPLTERWPHAWAAGCTVIGSTPRGAGVAEATDWPEATIDLPAEPEAAIETIEALLSDDEGLTARRFRNAEEALRRHDTRHRLARLLDELVLPRPAGLVAGLERLSEAAEAVRSGR